MTAGLRARQGGMGMLAILVIIALIVFFLSLAFKLGPSYAEFWTVRSIMNGVADSSRPITGGPREILDQIRNGLGINNINQVTMQDFSVRRTDSGLYEVAVEYERRQHLFFNVDAVLTFADQVEVRTQ